MDFLSIVQLPVTTIVFYALPFLVAIMVIVFVHEFGHFQVARWCGVKIEAFSIGFGKEITGWNDRYGTRWKLCWIPLGGYVKFEGDANAASMPDGAATEAARRTPGNFHSKPVWQRAAVVAAGPIANFILAILIFTAAYSIVGVPVPEARVADVLAGSAAEQAGIKAGDVFVSVDGKKIDSFIELQEAVMFRPGEQLTIIIRRADAEISLVLVPQLKEEPDGFGGTKRFGLLGVKSSTEDAGEFKRYGVIESFEKGIERTWRIVSLTMKYISKIFVGEESAKQIGGPISMAKVAGDAASNGIMGFVSAIAFLSISIGLINLFPIPMLDGGHLVYYGIEAVRGKPLGPNAQEWGFRIGLSMVVMLMLLGFFNDAIRVVNHYVGGT